ncbi:MAG TPA: hypothetical protein VII70_06895 [Steroidobacteraceae bacterium]
MTIRLSDLQQQALEHAERARSAGVKLSQYLRAQGIELRPIYDALAGARRKGAAGAAISAVAKRVISPFVEVRMASPAPTPTHSAIVCRVLIGGLGVIECGEWPPAAWVASMLGSRADAAP